MTSERPSNKRARSPSSDNALPSSKVPRIQSSQLQINYLVRQNNDNIPVITVHETLPEVLRLVDEYDGVLQRHESLAGNLGSCPLGPILLKRFERLFDGPPRILKSHSKDSSVTWLDVVEFAQNKPEQFNLEKQRNGVRVCQFYTKQCRVEISEEDFVLIASGMPQKLIPPQPIPEDEQKELEVLNLLDDRLGQVVQLADQVSARARQLIHKMKNRASNIIDRRELEGQPKHKPLPALGSPISPINTNGIRGKSLGEMETSQSPPLGFRAVNTKRSITTDGERGMTNSYRLDTSPNTSKITILNGKSLNDISPAERSELMKKFLTPSEREAGLTEHTVRRSSFGTIRTSSLQPASNDPNPRSSSIEIMGANVLPKVSSSVAIPHTPASLMPHIKPSSFQRDDGGPFKVEMVNRMELMQRGDRIIPPCDRCRRLHMDCLKNLTACVGCTKKHAKCSWKGVRMEELQIPIPATPDRDKGQGSMIQDDIAPPSAGSTIEVAKAVEEQNVSKTSTRGNKKNNQVPTMRSSNPPVSSPPIHPESFESTKRTGKFDLRPPPMGQHHLQDVSITDHHLRLRDYHINLKQKVEGMLTKIEMMKEIDFRYWRHKFIDQLHKMPDHQNSVCGKIRSLT